jgi:hypothetical protein
MGDERNADPDHASAPLMTPHYGIRGVYASR